MAQNRLLINHEQDSIQLSWQTGQAAPRFAPAISFERPFDTQVLAELRWYLEQYLRYPYGIEPERAAKIEQKFRDWGQQLFTLVFSRTEEAREFFQEAIREGLENCEIAIASDNPAVLNLPWELLYSPEHHFLAPLLAGIYRRVGNAHQPGVQTQIGEIPQDKLNILLVIARPNGEQDIAFKTIARPMLEALKPIRHLVYLKVLRPPSFQEFERELNANKGFYHIVHFDGHGTVNANGQGELVFEFFEHRQPIKANRIAQKLVDCRVPVFVLNACKSAQEGEEKFSSVAAQLILSGAKGVVAMAYTVWVEAAKHFMGGLYGELARGASLAEAVAAARKMVLNQPLRPSPKGNLPLQDWLVPVLYQQETYTPFTPKPSESVILSDSEGTQRFFAALRSAQNDICDRTVTLDLPEEGAYGFIGRDYDILRLERAFRKNHVGLLKGMGGVGKTELVCGFARWLDETQGRTGGIFFTSFEHGAGLIQVVNQIGRALWDDSFSQLMPEQQRTEVLEYLRTHPCLLIWDNFEPVAGFPTGNEPLLSDAERHNLKQFLEDLRGGKSWVLITSRREESWLDCNYKPLPLSGISGQDVEEFAAKILQRVGVGVDRAKLPEEYLKLLKLLGGHPLSLRVILPHLKAQSPIEIMEALRLGFDTFQGAQEEGRDKSLYVSLDYSFAKLSDRARQHLPFLALFSERVNVRWLNAFSELDDWEQAYRAVFGENLQKSDWLRILNEAVEAGILEHLGETIYKIHPALPWYLRQRLSKQHTVRKVNELEKKLLVLYGAIAAQCGQEMLIRADMATAIVLIEEPNLLRNLRLAERQQDWDNARLMLKVLGEVYQRQNRLLEFRTLRQQALEQIGTKFEQTKEAFQFWVYLQGENGSDALESADLTKASNIYQKISSELTKLNDPSMNVEIADVELCLGMVAQEQENFEAALTHYEKALEIFETIGDSDKAANVYHQLGSLSDKQGDLNSAITHYEKALETFETKDLYRSARTYNNLGKVVYQKQDFVAARNYWEEAITLFKRVGDLHLAAASYHNLSALALQQQDFDRAYNSSKEALKIFEDNQDLYNASDVYQALGEIAKKQGDFDSAITYFLKASQLHAQFNKWLDASRCLHNGGNILELQRKWVEALQTYIEAFAVDFKENEQWLGLSIRNLGRILKALGERQFEILWRELTGQECPEDWLSVFRTANEAEEE